MHNDKLSQKLRILIQISNAALPIVLCDISMLQFQLAILFIAKGHN